MADIINSVDRSLDMYIYDLYNIYIDIDISLLCEPNDAVRAVAVAKRREYPSNEALLKRAESAKCLCEGITSLVTRA